MRTCFKTKIFFLLLLLAPALGFAAEATPEKTADNSFNVMLIGLVSLAFVLLLAILVLGNTVRQLALVYQDKIRKQKAEGGISKMILLLVSFSLLSSAVMAQDAAQPATVAVSNTIEGIAKVDFYWLMGIIGLELLVAMSLAFAIRLMARLVSGVEQPEVIKEVKLKVSFWDRFNKVVPIEKEHDILLDHNYDGIQELDNSLPPWWKYGFYFTILVAVVYLWYYHAGGNGPSSYDEYVAEIQQGEEAKAAYLAKSANNVNENTVKMLDAVGITAGQTIFQGTCAACHSKDGGGGVGPNLTDDYWLHGGDIKDVFKSIKYGWADKGMKSWKDDFSPNQLAQLASYVKSLKGTKPAAPKDKQGELYIEGSTPAGPASTDSTKKVAIK
jgi:cytochrome c oxidase cbb3-type subunit 3